MVYTTNFAVISLNQPPPMLNPGQMITYTEAASLLRVTTRTIRRRVALGRYIAYGEHSGRRLVYESIIADIQRENTEVQQRNHG